MFQLLVQNMLSFWGRRNKALAKVGVLHGNDAKKFDQALLNPRKLTVQACDDIMKSYKNFIVT